MDPTGNMYVMGATEDTASLIETAALETEENSVEIDTDPTGNSYVMGAAENKASLIAIDGQHKTDNLLETHADKENDQETNVEVQFDLPFESAFLKAIASTGVNASNPS